MPSECPNKHPEALSRIIDGQAMVIVQRPDVTTIVLNEVATRIWELLDGTHGREAIAAQIFAEFDVESREAAERDVADVLEDMGRNGMLDLGKAS